MAEPARQPRQPPLMRALPRVDGRPIVDGWTDGQTAVDPSLSPSKRPSPRALTRPERILVRWLETYCVGTIPKHFRPLQVHKHWKMQKFIGARRLVLKYGADEIHDVIRNEMTQAIDPDRFADDPAHARLHWRETIVSPASFLNWYLREIHRTDEA